MLLRIAECRENAGMSQADLACALGVSRQSVAYYERPGGDVKVSVAIAIADALGVTLAQLVGLEGVTPPAVAGVVLDDDERELIDAFRALPRRDRWKLLGYAERMLDERAGEGAGVADRPEGRVAV